MPDGHPRLIRNTNGLRCVGCGGVHDYITRISDDAPCGVPVAFGLDRAKELALEYANGPQDVVRIPHELTTLVVMDRSARRLPRSGTGTQRLAKFEIAVRSM